MDEQFIEFIFDLIEEGNPTQKKKFKKWVLSLPTLYRKELIEFYNEGLDDLQSGRYKYRELRPGLDYSLWF